MLKEVTLRSPVKPINCLHFINGKYLPSFNGKTFNNINPATEEVLGSVAEGGKEEVDLAVQAARRALKGPWKYTTVEERSKLLRRIGDLILERKEELAYLESLDTGKPFSLAKTVDIPRAAYNFHFYADYIIGVNTDANEQNDIALHYTLRRPVGVIGIIKPWNLPLLLLTWKLAPALAMGNTCVIKPAEWTPITATVLMEIMKEAGLPDGVANLVHGFGTNSAGAAISEHPDVDAISFIGEPSTGAAIMRSAAQNLKKLSFELGGKNHNIIFADANIDDCIDKTIRSSFVNQGEVCLCGSRIYVERPIFDLFMEKFIEKTKELKMCDPLNPQTTTGAFNRI